MKTASLLLVTQLILLLLTLALGQGRADVPSVREEPEDDLYDDESGRMDPQNDTDENTGSARSRASRRAPSSCRDRIKLCNRVGGKCMNMKKTCSGKKVQSKWLCLGKNCVCCLPPQPPRPSHQCRQKSTKCNKKGGKCQPRKKTCKGKKFNKLCTKGGRRCTCCLPMKSNKCVLPWVSIGRNIRPCFLFGRQRMYWDGARAYCKNMTGDLAIVNGNTKRIAMVKYMELSRFINAHYWVGANHRNGSWLWLNGKNVTDDGWSPIFNQPNQDSEDNICMDIYTTGNTTGQYKVLYDDRCNETRISDAGYYFICQK